MSRDRVAGRRTGKERGSYSAASPSSVLVGSGMVLSSPPLYRGEWWASIRI